MPFSIILEDTLISVPGLRMVWDDVGRAVVGSS